MRVCVRCLSNYINTLLYSLSVWWEMDQAHLPSRIFSLAFSIGFM